MQKQIVDCPETEERKQKLQEKLLALLQTTGNENIFTFIGKCEIINQEEFTLYAHDQDVVLNIDKIQHVYKPGEQFCYSDSITICECTGLCRNK